MTQTQEPRSKRRRGGQPKPATLRKRNNLTFRARDQLKADLEKAAAAARRSVSEQIEYLLGRAFEWERVLGDLESFKAHLAASQTRLAEAERQTVAASLHRQGYGKVYDPSVPGGVRWFEPGFHNIPQSGFEDPNAPPPPPTLPPVLRDAVRSEVQSAVREILEEAGLLAKKKKFGGAAA
jgi:hypothetical protein